MVHSPMETKKVSVITTSTLPKNFCEFKSQLECCVRSGSGVDDSGDDDFGPVCMSSDQSEASADRFSTESRTNFCK